MEKFKYFMFTCTLVLINVFYSECSSNKKTDERIHKEAELSTERSEHAGKIELKPEIAQEIGIEVASVEKKAFRQVKNFPGTVVPRPDGEAHVGTLVQGRVVEIPVGLGERVPRGKPLCRIESPDVGEAQAAYIHALTDYQLAEKDLVRQRKLKEQKIGAEKSLLEKEARAQSSQAQLAAANRTLLSFGFSQEEINVLVTDHTTSGELTIKSPITGTVTDLSIRLGQRVDTEADLFHVVDLSRLWVKIALYEKDLKNVQCHQSVKIIPQSFPDKVFQGKVVQIGREVNQETRTIDCYVEVENKENILIPFLFVTSCIESGNQTGDVLTVPEDAVIIDEHGDQSVYTELEPYRYELKEVKTGRTCDGWTEIVEGLDHGDRVVFKGSFFIKSELAKASFGHGHAH